MPHWPSNPKIPPLTPEQTQKLFHQTPLDHLRLWTNIKEPPRSPVVVALAHRDGTCTLDRLHIAEFWLN